MKQCDKCRCGGRVERIAQTPEGKEAVYICPNPRCANYKQEFAKELLPPEKPAQPPK